MTNFVIYQDKFLNDVEDYLRGGNVVETFVDIYRTLLFEIYFVDFRLANIHDG